MNSLELLKKLSLISDHTIGVFPADRIPKVWTRPAAFILNTDDHTKPGMHWVSIYSNSNGYAYYFDSYGIPPFVPLDINRIRKNCKRYGYNTVQLQSATSDVCGQYCLMFLYYMRSELGFQRFLANFSDNLEKNDSIVRKYINFKTADAEFYSCGGSHVRYIQNATSKVCLI
ncbi:hypothetical protein TKK_0001588 [Trichogramma kaykai]